MAFSVHIIAVGKRDKKIEETVAHYDRLIKNYCSFTVTHIKSPEGYKKDKKTLVEKEAEIIGGRWNADNTFPVALSAEGKQFGDSVCFSGWLSKRLGGYREMTFIVGGAYGLSPSIKRRCREVISLSSLTMSHQICILVLLEQIYRAFTILNNHPYHK